MVLASPITHFFAQDSYERIRTGFKKGAEKPMTPNEPLYHFMIQTINMLADVGPKVMMTSSANPSVMSYYYQGPGKVAYRATTSNAYRMGSMVAQTLNNVMNYPYNIPPSVTTKIGRIGGKAATKLIPGIGWGLLAYDVYDLAVNGRLFGIQL